MQIRTKYEERILKEMYGLSERDQAKLYRVFHFIRQELADSESDEKQMTDDFLSICGTWEDDRTVEEQLHDIYSVRKSTNRAENAFEISV